MSKTTNIQTAVTFQPSAFVSGSYQGITGQTNPVGKTSNNTSNYATVNLTTGSGAKTYAFWSFDCSSIPNDATINSVSCQARAYVSQTGNTRVSTRQINLYSAANTGSTKGTAQTVTNTTNGSVLTIPGGTWTRSQLNNCYIGLYGVRGTSSNYTGTTYYFRFYGADLTVNYTYQGIAYEITASSEVTDTTIQPSSVDVNSGGSAVFRIDTLDLNSIIVKDNDVDVTESLEYTVPGTSNSFTGIPTTYDSVNSTYDSIYTGSTSDGLAPNTSSSRICVYVTQTAYAEGKLIYGFDCSSIPQNATITSVTCIAAAACYSSGQYFDTRTLQLYHGSTAKGSPTTITGNGNTSANHNIDGGSWTREELEDIRIVIYVKRGNNTTQASFSFWGATLTVDYTLPQQPYYQYTLTNIGEDHDIVIEPYIIVPPEEDPEKTYYSTTISSINATTTPGKGTTRYESGETETVLIYPSDPELTLAIDNGVDISSQLVYHSGTSRPTYTVTTKASGASYGFNLNSSTGYYVSTNNGVAKSASVARVNFDLPVRCLVTIQYINYAEANYDYGLFGNIDTTVSVSGLTANSSTQQSTPSDSESNYYLICRASSYNTSSVQTLTYEIPSGTHFVDIKYGKDDASDSNNDTLQWKITSVEPLDPINDAYYEYTLSNINQDHSLIFVFGDVDYYFITSSSNNNCQLYPDGQTVALPGDTYKLTIVLYNPNDVVTTYDNNNDVTNNLERKEVVTEKDGVSSLTVNYIYTLSNIQTAHTITVAVDSSALKEYVKVNNSYMEITNVYVKENNIWVEKDDLATTLNHQQIYINGGHQESH